MNKICRYCDTEIVLPDQETITFSYWGSEKFYCHKSCKVEGIKQEAIDCQTIDADCNDCYFYQRGKLADEVVSWIKKPDGSKVKIIHQPNFFVNGWCLKFDKSTIASPNKWTGHECFKHRRTF
ncbi:MAG: hypothetical protein Q7R95_09240, partial [bacterium]|nr:hypothetical protein [bacterium]